MIVEKSRAISISEEDFLNAGLKGSAFSPEILAYLENNFYLFIYIGSIDLSEDALFSRNWQKLRKLRWRIFILESYELSRKQRRRFFCLKRQYIKMLKNFINLFRIKKIDERLDYLWCEEVEAYYARAFNESNRFRARGATQ